MIHIHEAHVEHLLGRRVRDANGKVLGRIEELCAEMVGGELVVVEYRVGPAALLDRIGAWVLLLPFFKLLPLKPTAHRIPWQRIDLSDPNHPRLTS